MQLEFEIRAELKKLLGAIAHKNHDVAMKAHKALYTIGSPAIPFVTEALLDLDLSGATTRVKSAVEMRYVIALVSLIHDIDENQSSQAAHQRIQKGCRDATKQRLKSILEFTLNDYIQYEITGVRIFESKQIKSQINIQSRLERWFTNVSEDDLREIDRIYIISRAEDQDDASGYYTPIFYNIELVWDATDAKFNPLTWLLLIWEEMTLYHEIGHHVRKHTFGKIKEQEEEAESYAMRRFLSSRPALYRTLKVIFKVLKFFRRKPKWKAAA